jgi:4-oxalocrotonate tautomerase
MPIITLEGPPIGNLETRRRLVRELTAAAVAAYELPAEKIVVILHENSREQVGVGGELLVDKG